MKISDLGKKIITGEVKGEKIESSPKAQIIGMDVIMSPNTFEVQSVSGRAGKSAYDIWLDMGNEGSEADFMKYLTKAMLKYKGQVDTFADLPAAEFNKIGDFWNVEDTGFNFVWSGTEWDQISGLTDLSNYVDLTSEQTITGLKTFSEHLQSNKDFAFKRGSSIKRMGLSNDKLYLDGFAKDGEVAVTSELQAEALRVNEALSQTYSGKNLAVPDLTGKEYLGNGVYQLIKVGNAFVNYNVYNGIYYVKSSLTDVDIEFAITRFDNLVGNYSISYHYISGTLFEGEFSPFTTYNPLNPLKRTVSNYNKNDYFTYNYTSNAKLSRLNLQVPANSSLDIYFKLQIEQGDTATPYTLPMYVTPELINTKANDNEVVKLTGNQTIFDTKIFDKSIGTKGWNDFYNASGTYIGSLLIEGNKPYISANGRREIATLDEVVKINDIAQVYGGKNLAIPDLTGKEYLGNGIYRIHNGNGVTIDYNINNGAYVMNGLTSTGAYGDYVLFTFKEEIYFDNLTFSTYYESGYVQENSFQWILQDLPRTALHLLKPLNESMTKEINGNVSGFGFYFNNGKLFENYTVKIQIEQGTTATPYTLPMYVTPELINTKANDNEVVKTTGNFVTISGRKRFTDLQIAGSRLNWTNESNTKLGSIGLVSSKFTISDSDKNGEIAVMSDLTPSVVGARPAGNVPWAEVSGKPAFATVATSGSYNDLANKPNIPSKTSDLTNDSGFTTTTYVNGKIYLKSDTDNRLVATTPNDYDSKFEIKGLKSNTTLGISGGGTYSALLGIRGWTDSSGGNSHELAFDGDGAIYHRHGATTSWNAWTKLVEDNDFRLTNARPASSVNLYTIAADTINGATHGNAILRQLSGGQVAIGSDARQLRLTGNTTRPYYTTDNPTSTQGVELALLSDVSSEYVLTKPKIETALQGTGNSSIQLGTGAEASKTQSTALGYYAKASGYNSTAIGYGARASSDDSTAIGFDTYAQGHISTALGKSASASGYYSTALGYNTRVSGNQSTALGYDASTGVSDNLMRLGGDKLSTLQSKVSLTLTSDIRDKADIVEVPKALDFIKDLNPITYVSNDRENYISDEQKETDTYKDYLMIEDYDKQSHSQGTKKGKRRRVGLSAQEVREKLIEHYGSDNYANVVNDNFVEFKERELDIPEGLENKLTMSYETMVPFLIKAIQEQQEQIEELQTLLKGDKQMM